MKQLALMSILALFALAAAACGGSSGNPVLSDGGLLIPGSDGGILAGQSCSYTLSGAVTKTGPCVASAVWDQTKLSFVVGSTDAAISFEAELGAADNFAPKSYTSANVTRAVAGVTQVAGTTAGVWTMSQHDTTNPDTGTFALTISATGPSLMGGSGTVWMMPHGTASMTLTPDTESAAKGNVMVQVTF